MTIDIKHFYLNTPMPRFKYMKMKLSDQPEDVIKQYGLHDKVADDGYIYTEICKGMHGLPQAGLLAQKLLHQKPSHVPSWDIEYHPYMSHHSSVLQIIIFHYHLI